MWFLKSQLRCWNPYFELDTEQDEMKKLLLINSMIFPFPSILEQLSIRQWAFIREGCHLETLKF